ncbi:hypothetical protein Patl1_33817 [Pistacia atlantica]|uniref:Uncharacterized protein n=1 Tax=Pistacia atlantica TaxID=434234 RepID=A0ACC0ZSU4_9ROSI|nr:hypothetical protein Patl1_33817 [Pistacia atlantica]
MLPSLSSGKMGPAAASSIRTIYSNLPLWEPHLQPGSHNFSNGANFASGGAGVLEESNPNTVCFNVSEIACCGIGSHRGSGCGRVKEYELCSDPNEYVFFDGGHPSEHADSILSDFLWNGGSDYTWPLSMKQLYKLNSTTVIEILSEDKLLFTM